MSLTGLFEPRGVAVVGSLKPGKIGSVLIDQLLDGGYPNVYAVNPSGEGKEGAPGFRSIGKIDSPVDLVVVASPAETVASVIEDAGRAGVKAAIVITAGFSEIGNEEGEEEIVRLARSYGIRLVGPNCAGIVNTHFSLYPTLETRPPAGSVAFVSQSGALGGAVLSWAEEQGVGFSKFVSYGNGADLTEVDFLDYLREDPDSRVVCLYIETVSDGRRFIESARRLAAKKPLIVIKAGRSSSGRRATLSHTGSLAGEDAVYDAAIRQAGGIRVATVEEMFDLSRGFVHLRPVRGRRLAIVTNSGGPGVLAADRAEGVGLSVDPPSDRLKRRLAEGLPPICSLLNPVDLTVEGGKEEYRFALEAVLDEYDAAIAMNVSPAYLDPVPIARGVVAAAKGAKKPIAACFMAGRPVAPALPILEEGGVPNFATGERAVEVISRMAAYEERKGDIESTAPVEPEGEIPGEGPLLEPDGLDLLERLGLPVPERELVRSADQAVDAARRIGYPVVMKVVSAGIVHKSELGGVILGISGDDRAREGFVRLKRIGGRGFVGVLVLPQIEGGVEVLVGSSRDPKFGPVIAVGLGGIYTEVLRDVTFRICPIGEEEALRMIGELRAFDLLRGARGRPPADIRSLSRLIADLSQVMFRYPNIEEIDLNPVFALEEGALIGDARIIRKGG